MSKVRYSVSIGDQFERLTVYSEVQTKRYGKKNTAFRVVECKCACGGSTTVVVVQLAKGIVKSCGCLNQENRFTNTLKHGDTVGRKPSKLYVSWFQMKGRCSNPRVKCYRHYGGRGITVCQEWETFEPFKEWSERAGYKEGLTIERVNVNLGYFPENCTWIDRRRQAWNKRNSTRLTAFGEIKSLPQWADDGRCAVRAKTLHDRIAYGWDHEKAITTPRTR